MKNKFIISWKSGALVVIFFLLFAHTVLASITDGTIDSTYKYAWSDQSGYVNFGAVTYPTEGYVRITDTAITGYIWLANHGWVNLSPIPPGVGVSNTSSGNVGGWAWAANLGWIDFDLVTINNSGKFTGTAVGSMAGTITFDCPTYCDVRTDWRPESARLIFGTLISSVFDSTTTGAGFNSIMWKGTLGGIGTPPTEGKVRFQFATSNSTTGPWDYRGGNTCTVGDWFDPGGPDVSIELRATGANASTCDTLWNNKRYFRYKVQICSSDCFVSGSSTPTITGIILNWSP